jgi:hypothetical protein
VEDDPDPHCGTFGGGGGALGRASRATGEAEPVVGVQEVADRATGRRAPARRHRRSRSWSRATGEAAPGRRGWWSRATGATTSVGAGGRAGQPGRPPSVPEDEPGNRGARGKKGSPAGARAPTGDDIGRAEG